jgi:serine/threonine protein kinase
MESQIIDEKYRIVRVLGEGGMGAVYEAEHLVTGRRVALKVIVSQLLAREAGIVTRFQREARASGAIDSQYVVQVLDSGVDAATQNPYLVMEYLAGEDLSQLIHRLGVLSPDLALRVIAQACLGLQRAHDAGIIHRDIKSANTYLARRDNGEIVTKLLDFGIAKVRADPFAEGGDHKLTRTGSMIGSPLYMSPEQARGSKSLDHRADLWSLGVAMYEALAGSTPNHHCETIGNLIVSLCSEDAEPIQNRAPWVSSEIAVVVHKALAREVEKRFSTAAEMYDAIVAITGPSITIREDMLVPMADHEKAKVAPRLVISSAGSRVVRTSDAPDPDVLARTTLAAAAATGPGLDAGTNPGKPRSKASLALPALGVVALLGIAGATVTMRSGKTPETRSAVAAEPVKLTTSEPSAAILPIAPIEGSASTKGAPRTQAKASVIVSPPLARVSVDGTIATAREGVVEIEGAIGSVHKVELSLDGKSAKVDVVLSEAGPVPSRVEIPGISQVQAHGATGKPAASPAVGQPSAAAGPKPVAAKPEPAKPANPGPANEPAINRNF